MSDIQIQGLDALKAKFKSLPSEMAQKVLKKGVAAGARFVRDVERQTAPIAARPVRRGRGIVTAPGTMRRAAIIKFVREDSSATQIEYIVTFRQGKRSRKSGTDAFFARYVDLGHRTRSGGTVAGRRTLAAALSTNVDRVVSVMTQTMTDEMNKMPEFQR